MVFFLGRRYDGRIRRGSRFTQGNYSVLKRSTTAVSTKYRWQGSHSTWKYDSTARKPEKILEFCNLKQKSWKSGMNPRTKGRLHIFWFLSEQCSNVAASKLLKWVRKGHVT